MIIRVTIGCLAAVCLWGQGGGQSLPEGKGRAQFQRICGMCHGVEMATKIRQTPDQWAAVVDDMVNRGAQGTDDDFELVVNYLAKNFGPAADGGTKASAPAKVEVNTATADALTKDLGLSKSDADAIVQYRKDKGEFKDWSDLKKVSGLDLKKLESQKDRISFSSAQAPGSNPK